MNEARLTTIEQLEQFLSASRWQRNRLAEVPLAKRYRALAAPFARKYTALDVRLLVEMDQANEDVCGPAIAHLLLRAYRD